MSQRLMNEQVETRRYKGGWVVVLAPMTVSMAPLFYGVFSNHAFGDWSIYLGSRWFSEASDRLQLNRGCAPDAMLQNIYGFAFWYAVLVLGACAVATYVAVGNSGIRRLKVPLIVAGGGASIALVYFDAIFSLFTSPYTCRTTSFEKNELALSDEIVRHLCNEVGTTILVPVIVLVLSGLAYKRLKATRRSKGSSPT